MCVGACADIVEPEEGAEEQIDPVPLMDRSCVANVLEKVIPCVPRSTPRACVHGSRLGSESLTGMPVAGSRGINLLHFFPAFVWDTFSVSLLACSRGSKPFWRLPTPRDSVGCEHSTLFRSFVDGLPCGFWNSCRRCWSTSRNTTSLTRLAHHKRTGTDSAVMCGRRDKYTVQGVRLSCMN